MIKTIHLLFNLLLLSSISFAGGVKGKVTALTENGTTEILAFTSVYVEQTKSGTTTNAEGNYKINLPAGRYTIHFQYLGYESQTKSLLLDDDFVELNIQLKPISYQLQEAKVDGGREDPAVTVMRKAISKASYHRQQLDSYNAKVYIKGSGRVIDVPFFLRGKLKEEGFDSSMALSHESIMEVGYERPNTYSQKVISMRSSGKLNEDAPIGFVFGSFYSKEINGSVSPFSPHAFAYYHFILENTFLDAGYTVNKIRVVPRARGENVFWGHIYILEDLWNIYSLNLNTERAGSTVNIQQNYSEVIEKVWLPINHKFKVEVDMFGVEFNFNYLATVSDYQVELNEDLSNFVLVDEVVEEPVATDFDKKSIKSGKVDIGTVEDKKINRKDLKALMKEYEKQMFTERKDENKEDIQYISNIEIDSTAKLKDSAYWATVRPVPLSEYEITGNIVLDSIKKAEEKKKEADSLKNKEGFHPKDLIFGRTYQFNENNKLNLEIPIEYALFNTVDGFMWGYRLIYEHKFSKNRKFMITPEAKYNFARESVNAQLKFSFEQEDNNLNRFKMDMFGGRLESQFNPVQAIHHLENVFTTLFLERNYMRIYEKDFLHLGVEKVFKEKLFFKIDLEYAERWTLNNHSNTKLIDFKDRDYEPNIPKSIEKPFPNFSKHFAFTSAFEIKYRPWLKYSIINKQRRVIPSSSPEFSLSYFDGIELFESNLDFQRLELGLKHNYRLPAGKSISMEMSVGKFFRRENMHFTDYKHFMGNESPIVAAGPVGNFRLLEYYRLSTNNEYATAHVHYHFRKFLLTQILPVRLLGIKENLFVNYIYTPFSQNYTELGYGLDNIFQFFRVEGVASFEDGNYQSFGVRIGISTKFFRRD